MIRLYSVEDRNLREVPHSRLQKEDDLQRWIVANPAILGLNILVIGREIATESRGRIDVLGMDSDGNLVVIECKRDQTPRETIAQVLDYGSWVAGQTTKLIHALALSKIGRPLAEAFDSSLTANQSWLCPYRLSTSGMIEETLRNASLLLESIGSRHIHFQKPRHSLASLRIRISSVS